MTTETLNRLQNQANRNAEDAHRNRRLDRDAIVHAALGRLEASAYDAGASSENLGVYISAYASGIRFVAPEDVRAIIAEIRAQLSPVVRG